jgi:hypothetical protein
MKDYSTAFPSSATRRVYINLKGVKKPVPCLADPLY